METSPLILLVDDHPDHLEILEKRLRASGYRTRMVSDGAQALESARRNPPDLVVLDVMMPELNGFQVCRRLKEEYPKTPIIMLTAKSGAADRFWGQESGADIFLTKPADPKNVMEHVATLLGKE